ncbi:MAG: ammonia-forming cytochrome c nitrite reductase subunit c552 [Thermodesulfovibrionales bacterium]|nr:ammonia-forming cytochrome c nitrite reductase subunit c552 [Thermodesulfovibrionales bacterium]
MSKKFYLAAVLVAVLAIAGFVFFSGSADAQKAAPAKDVKVETCYGCHALVKDFHANGKHKGVNCVNCHSGLDEHLKNPADRPKSNTDHEACGKCHKNEMESFLGHNYEKKAQFDKGDPKSRSPYWETLVRPYAFEVSHNETRSHKYMLTDHLINDRSYGGRFQPKEKAQYSVNYASNKISPKAWDVLYDAYPEGDLKAPKKAFRERTAPAAVPVCLKCKTSDDHLAWPYMGDPSPKTSDISRVGNPAYNAVKYLRNSLPCIHCHDPHAAKHRIVRDALIDVLTTQTDTLWHEGYPGKADIKVYSNKDGLGLRGHERKIAILSKADPFLQCGQCHVEYNCGLHFDYEKSEWGKPPVALDFATDRRTNHFPFKGLAKVEKGKIVDETLWKHLEKWKYFDFAHYVTGAKLWKAQHPEVEAIYNSTHGKAGATCTDCHTEGVKKAKDGKSYKAHFHASPRAFDWKPCLKCHPAWKSEDAKYAAESAKNYVRQNMRKAEVWLRELVNAFQRAKDWGVDVKTLNEVRKIHEQSHMYWEWWTAENSDGFHNIENAKATLARSVVLSWKGIDILNKAIADKRAAAAMPAAMPAGK